MTFLPLIQYDFWYEQSVSNENAINSPLPIKKVRSILIFENKNVVN